LSCKQPRAAPARGFFYPTSLCQATGETVAFFINVLDRCVGSNAGENIMITIDWIDDHDTQPKSSQAFRQAPGASFSGLGELRPMFSLAQNRHRSLLEVASRVFKKARQIEVDESSDVSYPDEDFLPAMPRPRSIVNL
jgi:hypothetical protein